MRLFGAILLTALVTALLTSAVWIFLYNRADSPGRTRPVVEASRPAPAAVTVTAKRTEPRPAPVPGKVGTAPTELIERRLTIPVTGVSAAALTPQFFDERGERGHEAIDIMATRGEPVVAVEDGTVAKLFTSKEGGLTIYQFDPDERFSYYYAHLDRYAPGLAEGQTVKRGQVLGYVGSSGNADPAAPHLHFAIFGLGPEKQWWKGVALDPYPVLAGRNQ